MDHAIFAMTVGIAENWRHSGIMPCIRSDAERDEPVPYIIWCIETPDGPVVVDTAYHPDYVTAEWAQGNQFMEPSRLLGELGIRPEDVATVIVTHFHVDHFTGFDFFPKANFVIQKDEYDFWTGPMMRFDYLNKLVRPKVRPALQRLVDDGRVTLVDGDHELVPGVELLKAGGHTPGSQMVAVETAQGKAVLVRRHRLHLPEPPVSASRWAGTSTCRTRCWPWTGRSRPRRARNCRFPTTTPSSCRANG